MHACRLTIDGRGPAHNRRTRTVLVSVEERGWWWVPKRMRRATGSGGWACVRARKASFAVES
eukprot:79802-Prymnesium_polylepis.1